MADQSIPTRRLDKTGGSTNGERRFASGVEVTLLDELDSLVEKRNHQEGVVGNLYGDFKTAERLLTEGRTEWHRLEARARQVRNAFEVLRATMNPEDDTMPEPGEEAQGDAGRTGDPFPTV